MHCSQEQTATDRLAPTDDCVRPLLDQSVLTGLIDIGADDGQQFLDRLIELYAQSWTSDLAALLTAIEQQDSELARKHVHRMKSASANLGAARLATYCSNLERAAGNGQLHVVSNAIAAINSIHGDTVSALHLHADALGRSK